MQLKRLSILGVGLLGGSVGLAVKSAIRNCKIIGYGHRPESLEAAQRMGAIDQWTTEAATAVEEADLILLCTPVGIFQPLLERIGPILKRGAIVSDVGSTKRKVVTLGESVLPQRVHFVGSHPMAGSEKRGVEFARADLFANALCLLTPTERTDQKALETMEGFWRLLGMRTRRLSPEAHDRLLAQVSHLPHAVAAALTHLPEDAALEVCGRGFLDTTRIAEGEGGLWRDILLENRDNVGKALARLQEALKRLEVYLQNGDGPALQKWLADAAGRRSKLTEGKAQGTGGK